MLQELYANAKELLPNVTLLKLSMKQWGEEWMVGQTKTQESPQTET